MYLPWKFLIFAVFGDVELGIHNPSQYDSRDYGREDSHDHQGDPKVPEISSRTVYKVWKHLGKRRHVVLTELMLIVKQVVIDLRQRCKSVDKRMR